MVSRVPWPALGPMARRTARGSDHGSGSILAVAIVAAMLALLVMSVPLYVVLSAKQRAASAADAAALAASSVALGIVPGAPCAAAASVSAANGAMLQRCAPDGAIVTVRVSVFALGFEVPATATAGPRDAA
ncbi:Rv3654c family TadE-like protein [Parafrigoribacterium soli]|uniref:Rv3654c family TadE-like protein n=1 Tax=Parafrigoribacterium soli TaxID=3144663 RepID=UPI0032EE2E99